MLLTGHLASDINLLPPILCKASRIIWDIVLAMSFCMRYRMSYNVTNYQYENIISKELKHVRKIHTLPSPSQ